MTSTLDHEQRHLLSLFVEAARRGTKIRPSFTYVRQPPSAPPHFEHPGLREQPAPSVADLEVLEQAGLLQHRSIMSGTGEIHLTDRAFETYDRMIAEAQGLHSVDLTLGEQLGRGGFGQVFKCTHPFLQIDFAVKLFAPAFADDEGPHLQRFFREARILFALNHPNIVRVFDIGMFEDRPFIRMEYFPGITLSKRLGEAGRVPPEYARNVIAQTARGLQHAHAANVLHRDLKPSNVMVLGKNAEELRILDFGLGVFVETDITNRFTKTGERLHGDFYTAPELVANPKLLEPHVDIYSVGAIWYELVTGRPPAGANIEEALDTEVQLTAGEREILLRCLRTASKRFASASELLNALESLEQREPQAVGVDLGQTIRELAATPGTETNKLFKRLDEAKRTVAASRSADRLRKLRWPDPDVKLCPYCSSSFPEKFPGQPCPACGKSSK